MATVVYSDYLEFVAGTSDKFYLSLVLEMTPGKFQGEVWFGRRGSQGQCKVYADGVSRVIAQNIVDQHRAEKRHKGYSPAHTPSNVSRFIAGRGSIPAAQGRARDQDQAGA